MVDENRVGDVDAVLQKILDEATSAIMRGAKPDAEALKILCNRIVTPEPEVSAVEHAVADILNLARNRAES